jgi:hypothetical protein
MKPQVMPARLYSRNFTPRHAKRDPTVYCFTPARQQQQHEATGSAARKQVSTQAQQACMRCGHDHTHKMPPTARKQASSLAQTAACKVLQHVCLRQPLCCIALQQGNDTALPERCTAASPLMLASSAAEGMPASHFCSALWPSAAALPPSTARGAISDTSTTSSTQPASSEGRVEK